jgi:hypothetical protein
MIAFLFHLEILILIKNNIMATTHKDRIATATAVKKKNEGPFATEREASEAKNGELMKRVLKMNVKEFVDKH